MYNKIFVFLLYILLTVNLIYAKINILTLTNYKLNQYSVEKIQFTDKQLKDITKYLQNRIQSSNKKFINFQDNSIILSKMPKTEYKAIISIDSVPNQDNIKKLIKAGNFKGNYILIITVWNYSKYLQARILLLSNKFSNQWNIYEDRSYKKLINYEYDINGFKRKIVYQNSKLFKDILKHETISNFTYRPRTINLRKYEETFITLDNFETITNKVINFPYALAIKSSNGYIKNGYKFKNYKILYPQKNGQIKIHFKSTNSNAKLYIYSVLLDNNKKVIFIYKKIKTIPLYIKGSGAIGWYITTRWHVEGNFEEENYPFKYSYVAKFKTLKFTDRYAKLIYDNRFLDEYGNKISYRRQFTNAIDYYNNWVITPGLLNKIPEFKEFISLFAKSDDFVTYCGGTGYDCILKGFRAYTDQDKIVYSGTCNSNYIIGYLYKDLPDYIIFNISTKIFPDHDITLFIDNKGEDKKHIKIPINLLESNKPFFKTFKWTTSGDSPTPYYLNIKVKLEFKPYF